MSTNAKYLEQLLLLSLNLPMAAIINQSVLILFPVELDPVLQKSAVHWISAIVVIKNTTPASSWLSMVVLGDQCSCWDLSKGLEACWMAEDANYYSKKCCSVQKIHDTSIRMMISHFSELNGRKYCNYVLQMRKQK